MDIRDLSKIRYFVPTVFHLIPFVTITTAIKIIIIIIIIIIRKRKRRQNTRV